MSYTCPICGFPNLERLPYTDYGSPSHEICECCSYEFGWHDLDQGISHEQWRAKWMAQGMLWNEGDKDPDNPEPPGYDPKRQLLNIGIRVEK